MPKTNATTNFVFWSIKPNKFGGVNFRGLGRKEHKKKAI